MLATTWLGVVVYGGGDVGVAKEELKSGWNETPTYTRWTRQTRKVLRQTCSIYER